MPESRTAPATGERLAKVIARAGLCSRRDAETWIAAGRVAVNGKTVRTPAFNVTERDRIEVDGEPLAARQGTRLWLYHKPPGLVVTESDPEGRPTVFEALAQKGLPRVLSVGRLDIATEGLLLVTNDGGLKRVLELPATGWLRKYRVRAFGTVTQEALDRLKAGVEVDGIAYGPIDAVLERVQGANVWLLVSLREGKNREVKNVLATLGLEVNRLIRISYGPFQLGDIPVGAVETVKARVLRDQLGDKLAAAAGVDFDAPMPEPLPAAATAGAAAARPKRTRTEGERPVRHRPGRHGFDERPRRPAKPGAEPRAARTVHFDDGRPSESFVPKAKRADDPDRRDGKPARGRPSRSRDDDRSGRPSGERARKPHADRRDRPAPRDERPARDTPGAASRGKPAHPSGSRAPDRSSPRSRPSGAKPSPAKPAGTKPMGTKPSGRRPSGPGPAGPRPSGPRAGPRPSGPRPSGARPAGRRPSGPRPPRRDR